MPLLSLLPVFGCAFCLFSCFRRQAEACLFAAVAMIIAALYVFALLGALRPGARVLFYLGLALMAWGALRMVREPEIARGFLRPGVLVFLLLCVCHYAAFGTAGYFFWDEFSHWGLATRELLAGHRIADTANLHFPHYPPAVALWHYFVCGSTIYSEGATYLAHFVLLIAPLTVLFKGVAYRQWYWTAAVLLLIWFGVSGLGHGISKLYVDHLVATAFAGAVLTQLSEDNGPVMLVAPGLFILPLIKEAGMVFGLAGALFVCGHRLLTASADTSHRPGRAPRWRRWAAVGTLLLSPLLAWGSWQSWLAYRDIGLPYAAEMSPAEDHGNPEPGPDASEDLRARIRQRFWVLLLDQPQVKGKEALLYNEFSWGLRKFYRSVDRMSAFQWAVFCLLAFTPPLLFARRGRDRLSLAYTAGFLLLLFIGYTFLLLKLYTDIFDPAAGLNMVSYLRYTQMVLLPMVLIAAAVYLPAWREWYRPAFVRPLHLIFFALLALIYLFETPYMPFLWKPAPGQAIRYTWAPAVSRIKAEVPKGNSVYVVDTAPRRAFTRMMLHFDLSPVRSVLSPPDIGRRRAGEIEAELREHDYIWLYSDKPEIMSRFHFLMEKLPQGPRPLFKVERNGSRIRLSPVDG